jgi:hypothetical protein
MKLYIKRLLRENLESNGIIRLYHKIGNKQGLDIVELIRGIFKHGLVPHDNGEVGSVIWFSPDYNDYAAGGTFVVAYDYDRSKTYAENNGISYPSWGSPFGNEQIPFDALEVIKVPIMSINNRLYSNEDVLKLINVTGMTPERFNGISSKVIIFGDLFNQYIQPKIDQPNFLDGIDQSKIKLINVLS